MGYQTDHARENAQRRLEHLEAQATTFGYTTPPEIKMEIADLRAALGIADIATATTTRQHAQLSTSDQLVHAVLRELGPQTDRLRGDLSIVVGSVKDALARLLVLEGDMREMQRSLQRWQVVLQVWLTIISLVLVGIFVELLHRG